MNNKYYVFDCSCCGGEAKAFKQWYNQDDGFGICRDCFHKHVEKYGLEVSKNYFGEIGIHHSIESKLKNQISKVKAVGL